MSVLERRCVSPPIHQFCSFSPLNAVCRDLIASADTIVAISQQCQAVSSALDSLGVKVDSLAASLDAARNKDHDKADTSSFDRLFGKHLDHLLLKKIRQTVLNQLTCCSPCLNSQRSFSVPVCVNAAIGSRIKYLIDSPETIYGCLDGREFLEAAQRYVRAVEVHRSFSAQSKTVSQRFPLLQHQWPLVKKLGGEAWDRAITWLGSQGGATPQQLADVLYALALLRPVDGAEALKYHLSARQTYILSCLAQAAPEGEGAPDPETVSIVLSDVATLVCTTVAQCGELFLTRPGVTAQPLLLAAAGTEDSSATELLFDAVSGKASAEMGAWLTRQSAACERLGSISAAGVALECSQWLENLAGQVAPLCARLMMGCETGAALRRVESAVRESLQGWRYSLGREEGDGTGVAGEELSWTDACQWVVGRPTPLWPLLMEGPLVARAQALIAAQFAEACDEVARHMDAVVQENAVLVPCAPGSLDPGLWSDTLQLDVSPGTLRAAGGGPAAALRRRSSQGGQRGVAESGAVSSGDAAWWMPRAEALLGALDSKLQTALAAALDTVDGPQGTSAAPAAALSERALAVQPFTQEKCSKAAEDVAAALAAAVAALPRETTSEGEQSRSVGVALIVGRVAAGLAERSIPLPVLLGPPSAWASSRQAPQPGARTLGATAATLASTTGADVSPRLAAAQQWLMGVAADAYNTWACWAGHGLAQRLVAQLAADGALGANAPLRGWEDAVIEAPEEAGGQVKFSLPATPSPAAMDAALGACVEIERAGGHRADTLPVQQLRWELMGGIYAALHEALAPGGALSSQGAVSEKGVLQLLFDVRFLATVLTGQPPYGMPTTASASRKREVAEMEGSLVGRIDPIDWATYESRLHANVAAFVARSKVVLGLAARGSAPGPATAHTTPVVQPADSNVLAMATPGPRFVYLPVKTPNAVRQRAQVAVPMAAKDLLDSGEESQYSFATLKVHRTERAEHALPAAIVRDSAASASAGGGMGAAAIEALRQSTLGSLLGDKAAEMSATLGEYSFSSLSQGGSGLLSTLQLPSFKR